MTPEELTQVIAQAQTEVDEQGHGASALAIAVLHQRDALSHYATGLIWSPTCSGCSGLTQRAEQAERSLRNAEAAVSADVVEINRMRDINIGLDVQIASLQQAVTDLEAQRDSLGAENAAHLDTIAQLQAQIEELQNGGGE